MVIASDPSRPFFVSPIPMRPDRALFLVRLPGLEWKAQLAMIPGLIRAAFSNFDNQAPPFPFGCRAGLAGSFWDIPSSGTRL